MDIETFQKLPQAERKALSSQAESQGIEAYNAWLNSLFDAGYTCMAEAEAAFEKVWRVANAVPTRRQTGEQR